MYLHNLFIGRGREGMNFDFALCENFCMFWDNIQVDEQNIEGCQQRELLHISDKAGTENRGWVQGNPGQGGFITFQ